MNKPVDPPAAASERDAWRFFGLVLAGSVPFYLLGMTGADLPGPLPLPITTLMILVPMLVALSLVLRDQGVVSAVTLFLQAFDLHQVSASRGGPVWLGVAVLFMPLVTLGAFIALRLTGVAIPAPDIAAGDALLVVALYLCGAIPEEIGWQAYAFPVLARTHSALVAALIVGSVWALWHLVPFALMGRGAEWIIWHSLCTVLLRVVIVWLAANTGRSLLIAVVFHAMLNTVWSLFPVNGSFYDPRVTFVILLPIVIGIVAVWGPATLARPHVAATR